ncbi:transmembrane protein, putative (macronuclear) [Tetrahymena thermophila SB210]|uniref:Transmembrane protein, putative n=1 Tax=Tetrahymena thermophila (strain SB210) TaxID=312017 RepID=W7XA36_TETTS|nr:transmembrane protein, putative [Tetrahymena thermophila SB210]EWS76260.1 transmembrane protein, putative [Tetrahymena thermophila SB210]|eukprot:XP_012651219.1 transmembrane protein, putative [Tetrahymena thermophila SB210]
MVLSRMLIIIVLLLLIALLVNNAMVTKKNQLVLLLVTKIMMAFVLLPLIPNVYLLHLCFAVFLKVSALLLMDSHLLKMLQTVLNLRTAKLKTLDSVEQVELTALAQVSLRSLIPMTVPATQVRILSQITHAKLNLLALYYLLPALSS